MSLSSELISQFVKITNDNTKPEKETTVYGTAVSYNGETYVQLDGSDLLTPISSIDNSNTVSVKTGERVIVMIKNHHIVVTGNTSSPAATSSTVKEAVLASAELLTESGDKALKIIQGDEGIFNEVNTVEANVVELRSKKANVEDLNATNAEIENLEAAYGEFTQLTADQFTAQQAAIDDLSTNKLDAETADIKYANIDFSNIGNAAMEYLYAASGLIENVTIADGTITGRLVGVTIKGDTIEGNTIVANKLVIQGKDGLYYKLNTDGVTTEAEQTEYNSLDGSIITAKSITATKISVSDLVAFDATIGGFSITENSIFSEVKDDEGNTTRGIYMDVDGQFNFGDATNFVKYYRQEDGTYKLAISAESIMYSLNGTQHSISDLGMIGEYVEIGTYEGEPCIELGEKDSDFKLIITNTRIQFMEGTTVPAYINNQSLHISKAVVEEELQQGGFVWKVRSNGNLGLVWKGVNS